MIKKIRVIRDGFENLKKNQILFLISALYSFIFISFLYSSNISLPKLITLPLNKVFIFLMLLLILFCAAYFFERFLIALMIRISSEKRKNLEKSFSHVEKITGIFIIASFIYLCLGGASLLASQLLTPIEFFIFMLVILIIAIKATLYEYAIAIDGVGVKHSFIISWKLTENNWWDIFFIKSFFALIFISVSALLYFVSQITIYNINFYLVGFLLTWLITPWEISTFSIVFNQLKKEKKIKLYGRE